MADEDTILSLSSRIPSGWYVYVLRNPTKPGDPPFYVGKGKGRRIYTSLSPSGSKNPHKDNTIKFIRVRGLSPLVTIHPMNTEAAAFRLERLLISLWGRGKDGGMLTNLSLGGEGPSGHTMPPSARAAISKSKQGKARPPHVLKILRDKNMGNTYCMGRVLSEDSKAKIRASLTGHKMSQYTCSKMSINSQGEGNRAAKLNVVAVRVARWCISHGRTYKDIANAYGMQISPIHQAVRGWTWACVTDPPPIFTKGPNKQGLTATRSKYIKVDRVRV